MKILDQFSSGQKKFTLLSLGLVSLLVTFVSVRLDQSQTAEIFAQIFWFNLILAFFLV